MRFFDAKARQPDSKAVVRSPAAIPSPRSLQLFITDCLNFSQRRRF
jgi:hypothetical protein